MNIKLHYYKYKVQKFWLLTQVANQNEPYLRVIINTRKVQREHQRAQHSVPHWARLCGHMRIDAVRAVTARTRIHSLFVDTGKRLSATIAAPTIASERKQSRALYEIPLMIISY